MDGDLVLQRRGGFMPEKIAQGLLLAGLRDGRDPVKIGPKRGQFAGLGDIAELAASFALELPPPVATLLKS